MLFSKNVFVIMPFSDTASCSESEWTDIFENVFRPACEACEYSCERALPKTGSLISSIIESLKTARIVIADITDRNPNVFYELGVRHSLSKRTIIISQRADDIPSDLRGYWSLQYGIRPGDVAKFKNDIKRLISEIEKSPDKSDSPVSDYLERENLSVSWFAQKENIKKLGSLYTELSGNVLSLKALRAEKGQESVAQQLSTDCLKLLLHTLYVDPGPDILQEAYELLRDIEWIRSGERAPDITNQAFESCDRLSKKIIAMRDSLSLGNYEEPPSPSTMVWQSPESQAMFDLVECKSFPSTECKLLDGKKPKVSLSHCGRKN